MQGTVLFQPVKIGTVHVALTFNHLKVVSTDSVCRTGRKVIVFFLLQSY
jgi:hypothetical protein